MSTPTEIQNIEAAIQTYFDGLYEGDAAKLAQVFNAAASLFIARDGALTVLPVPQWLERVAARPSPLSQNAARADKVLMIDRTGPVNALVKVSCMLPPVTYTDYLSLIHIDGRWQIVAKAYCEVA
jgi:hypothetical protein